MEEKGNLFGFILVCVLMFCYGFGAYYIFLGQNLLNEKQNIENQLNQQLIEAKWQLNSCYQQLGDLEDICQCSE